MRPKTPLRIVFAGTPDFAAHYLGFLLENSTDEVVGVYTQPDRPAGRGKKLQASAVKQLAEQHQLQVYQPENLKTQDSQKLLRDLNADLMIVVAYGLILPQAVLDIPRCGCINVHASLLPRWRGAAPIQRAIEAGDKISGVTIMQMDAGLDTGDMLAMGKCDIGAMDTGGSLHDKLMVAGEASLLKVLEQIHSNSLEPRSQNDADSSYAAKISKHEAAINWHESAELIERKIRAFHPFPIAHTEIDGQRIRVHQAFVSADENSQSKSPGTILGADDQGIDVSTGSGVIRVKQLQIPGKRALPAADVLRGNAAMFEKGCRFN